MKKNSREKNYQTGLTIIEVLVVLFILVLVGTAVVTFQINIFSLNKISSDSLTAEGEARQAFKVITSEIRTMTPSSMGAYAIDQVGTSSITFYSNVDNDSLIEKVRYFLSGNTLKRGVIKPSGNPLTYTGTESFKEMVHNIANATSSIFSYYDANYDGTSAPLSAPVNPISVRLIKVNIIIDHDPVKSPPPFLITTQVSIRNLKDNL